ncbi:hypothetical protein V502_04423 [Pseudogymnoascus sp. VKM F-4520 (FW-2644)]|nr:hypothetical protein V502_04423 [Pseudogymnoascus sp. VKM F-4520 (FW-2644)]
MRSSLFLIVAGAIGFAWALPQVDDITDCKDGSELVTCLNSAVAPLNDGSCSTVSCACDIIKTEIACYKTNCPEYTIPSKVTDEYNNQCASAKGAAGMLSVPSVGLVAGVVGVMAML